MIAAALIFNPRAGNWRTAQKIAAIEYALADVGYHAKPLPTEAAGHASELAREAADEGAEVVFVHGGDGTLREAAAGLLGSDTAIAPIPGGTVNVIAGALGLPQNPVLAAKAMADAEIVEMDVGQCGEEIFLMQASAGLDAHIMGNLNPGLKRRFGKIAVAYAGLLSFTTYRYPSIELFADGHHLSASLAVICNLPYYAGRWQMAPGAEVADRILDLVLFTGKSGLKTLAFARDFVLGRHLERQDVRLIRVREVELRAPGGLAVQLDGDTLPVDLPVTVGVHPDRIHILRPRSTRCQHGSVS